MNREKFTHLENYSIGVAICREADVGMDCWASQDGLPAELLANYSGYEMPTVYMRMIAGFGGDDLRLKDYLEKEVGLVDGVDFLRHGNGVRGGMHYFDFLRPDTEQRFESFMAERGIEPGVKYDYNNPSPAELARREQRAKEFMEDFEQYRREKAERKGPLSFLRFVTKSPPRSR